MPMKPIIPVYAIATAVIIDASVSIKNMTCWTFKPNDRLFNSPNCNNLIAGTILSRINIIGIAIRPMYMTSRVSAAANPPKSS